MNEAEPKPLLGPKCRRRLGIVGLLLLATAGGAVLYSHARRAKKPEDAAPKPSGAPTGDTGAPAPAVLALRNAVDRAWPNRGKASDGIMGDASHQARPSDHNQGNAIDITLDPVNGPDLDALAEAVLKDPRVTYVIWKNRIQSRTISPGQWRPYDGANPHTKHMHVSIDAAKRGDASPWDVGRRAEA